jgi:hypothetical protein
LNPANGNIFPDELATLNELLKSSIGTVGEVEMGE